MIYNENNKNKTYKCLKWGKRINLSGANQARRRIKSQREVNHTRVRRVNKSKRSKSRNSSNDSKANKEEMRRQKQRELEERRRLEEQKRLRKAIYLDKLLFSMPDTLPEFETSFVNLSIKTAQERETEAKQSTMTSIRQGLIDIPDQNVPLESILISLKADAKKHELKDSLRKLHLQKNIMDSDEYNFRMKQVDDTFKKSPTNLQEALKLEMSLRVNESNSTGRVGSKQVTFRSKSKEEVSSDHKLLLAKIK